MKNSILVFSFFLFSSGVFFSCSSDATKNNSSDSIAKQQVDTPYVVKLDFTPPRLKSCNQKLNWTFLKIGQFLVSGCGCAFAEKQNDLDAKKYSCAINFDSIAVVSIADSVNYLNLRVTNKYQGTFPGDTLHCIYANDFFSLEIKVLFEKKVGEEVDEYSGVAILKSATEVKHIEVHGYCGC